MPTLPLASIISGVPFADYQKSYVLRRAVERALQIISEAARALPPDMLKRHGEVPWTAIIGIGNVLRHEYQRLDDRQLWEIATHHLPQLHPVVLRMIAEYQLARPAAFCDFMLDRSGLATRDCADLRGP